MGPPPAPKKVGSSKTRLLMSYKHTLSRFFIYFYFYLFFLSLADHFAARSNSNSDNNREKETSLLKT
jgi:hypothetical protein